MATIRVTSATVRAGLADAGRAGDTLVPRDVAREQAERRERDWAQWEFRSRVEATLAAQGVGWPKVETDEWGGVHYRLPPVPKRASWLGRLLYGPCGKRRVRA